ncbi:MAG: ribose 5-phosphate isomerase B [Ignavibacteriales bacterium]|nr:ribose 5-phosphate isomerase B [Ignavibacteriales bacterium]
MIAIGSDHAGYQYKEQIKDLLDGLKIPFKDVGPNSTESTDYPDWAHKVAQCITSGECDRGILVCGTGIGMAIVANKHKGVRAAACESVTAARLARQHNDANVLAIGGRIAGWETVIDIVKTFFSTSFDGGRHERRIQKIHSLTNL